MANDGYALMDSKAFYVESNPERDPGEILHISWKYCGEIYTFEHVAVNWPSEILVLHESLDSYWGSMDDNSDFPDDYVLSEEAYKDYEEWRNRHGEEENEDG